MRLLVLVGVAALAAGCGGGADAPAPSTPPPSSAPAPDPQHQGVVGPHGDHSPHRGGMVLMYGDIHYEVVFATDGHHRVWFTDAVRSDLPASVASGMRMEITRQGEPAEVLQLAIDDNGESWIANGKPVTGNDAYVKITYTLQGEPHEVELPLIVQPPPTQ
jgi:hypothetical protein